jgi:hypothetical protein
MAPDDDYLWDKRGTPDPEIEKLEHTLGKLAHQERPLVLPELPAAVPEMAPGVAPSRAPDATPLSPSAQAPDRWSLRRSWLEHWRTTPRAPALALAAAVVVVIAATVVWQMVESRRGWEVASLEGAPRAADRVLASGDRLAPGQWLTTDASSRARLKVGDIGVIDVEPHSRVRLIAASRDDQRLAMQVGGMRAIIIAPPRRFQVETPSALAVDLGCAYFLEVAPDGGSQLTVEIGWVSFESGGRESFVPAGARCITRPGLAPGTPCFTDAAAEVKNGLAMFDFGVAAIPGAPDDSVARRSTGLAIILHGARKEDALTLWHLLARTHDQERAQVYDALAARVPPPAGVTRDGIVAGDPTMLEHWWDALGFGDTATWRHWRRPWGELGSR